MSNLSIESFDRYTMSSSSKDSGHDLASHQARLPKSYHQILNNIPCYFEKKQVKNPLVLDLAMGSGDTSRYLEKHNLKVVKADLSFSALKNIDGLRYRCRADELPFGNESFDAIHFKDALVHIENMDKLFSEFNRVLKPGGVLLLTTAENYISSFNYLYKENKTTLSENITFETLENYCNLVSLTMKKPGVISINPPYFKVENEDIEKFFKKNNFNILSSAEWRRKSNEPDWYRGKMPRIVYFAEKQ